MTFVPEQIVVALAPILTDGVAVDPTVIVIALDVAVVGFAQGIEDVITTVTTSLLASAAFWYVKLFVPTLAPFNFHWKDGVAPPSTGVAVNITLVPVHIVVADAAMVTDGTTDALTVTVNEQFTVGEPVSAY